MRTTFGDGGQVGRDLLAVDWDATGVGDPDEWPNSLRAVVRLVLASRFSMWMAWGPELTFFCNDAYRRDTLGTKYPWALGRPASEVWHEIWEDIGPRIASVLATGQATWDEQLLLFLERSGFTEETYHTFSYSPLADDDGTVTGMLCVVSEDTDAVVASRRMRTLRDLGARTTADVTEAETVASACRVLGTNGQDLPFVLCYLYEDGAATAELACNAGFEDRHRAAPQLLRRDDPSRLWPMPTGEEAGVELVGELDPRVGPLPAGAWEQAPAAVAVVPLPASTAGASYGFLVVGVNPFRPWDGAYADFLELIAGQLASDITDARAFEFERARAESLAALDQAKTDFFTNISHEFRTPLTLLLGPAEDALADPAAPLPDSQRHRVEVIRRNAQRLLKLVNTLLDFSRLESGGTELAREPVDLASYTRELVSMFESAAARLGLALVVDCPPLPAPVRVDPDAWGKVVLNLLSNALKFTLEGEVRVTVSAEDEWVRLEVADTGGGIPPQDQARLFERFRRAAGARSRTHEGSGIGLALVAELVTVHGGTVEVASAVGEGSTFTVRLPYDPQGDEVVADGRPSHGPTAQVVAGFLNEAESLAHGQVVSTGSAASGTDRARVLVVDDNADVRSYVHDLLVDEYDVLLAVDGLDALARVREERPDLVLTDVMMPRLDGFGLLTALREDEETQDLPVVMLSARAGEEGTVEGLEAGADDYLVKPFSARELLARVRSNLELDRARRAREQLERSQSLLDQAQRLASVGSWEADLATGRFRATEEFRRIAGLDREELERLRYPDLIEELVHPDDRELVARALSENGSNIRYEARLVRGDGLVISVSVHAELETDPNGTPVRLHGSVQDITERLDAERKAAEATAAQEVAAREHAIATELQSSLLPATSFDLADLEVATYYRAGVEGTDVGGDWYDVIELAGGRTALVIGDVMGRGVRAAAVMGQLRAAIRAYARLDLPPADLLEHLDGLVSSFGADQIVTCTYAVFDPADSILRVANAGHLPLVLCAPDGHTVVAPFTSDPPLGAGGGRMEQVDVPLPVGSSVLLFTDGLVERRGEDLDEGIATVRALCAELDIPLSEVPEELVRRRLPTGQDDDVAILVARVRSSSVLALDVLDLDHPDTAASAARAGVREHLVGLGADDGSFLDDAVLVTSELVTNALLHADVPVRLRLVSTHGELRIEVHDSEAAQPHRRRPADDDEHGRGLTIVAGLSDQWGTWVTPSGKAVWSVLRRPG